MSEEEIKDETKDLRQHRSPARPKTAEDSQDKAEAARNARMAKMAESKKSQEATSAEDKVETAPLVAPAAAPLLGEHIVASGDTLTHIAKKYYNSTDRDKWMAIYEANKEMIGDNPSLIRVGQVLKIPQLSD